MFLNFKKSKCSLILCFLFVANFPMWGQKTDMEEPPKPDFDTSTTIFQKISTDEFLEVVLETNFDSLLKNKRASTISYPGTILFKNRKGEEIKTKVKIEPRGKSRRRYCSMPPLKIDFPKKMLAELGLYPGCDKLKLVTHCNDTESSDQVLMKEFWVYKLYNQITPESFRVFPVNIVYVNSNNPDEKIHRQAFFIENNEEMALRINGEIKDMFGTTPEILESQSYYNTLLFNYMVGNLDWDILVNRNVKFVKKEGSEKFTLVPYDFDFSGLVKAPHARLNPDFNQKNIEDRFPQGKFTSKAALDETVKAFKALESESFQCYMACPILNKRVKKKMQKYLGSFFNFLKDEDAVEAAFLME